MNEMEPTRSSSSSGERDIATEKTTLGWTVHPVKRKPLLSVGITLLIFVIGLGVYSSTDSAGFAGLALAVLFASLAKFYFPTSYQLTAKEIIVKTSTQTLRKEWKLYRSCYPDKKGVFLSPFEGRSRLENFRGIYLMCNDNIPEVAAFARARMGLAAVGGANETGGSSG